MLSAVMASNSVTIAPDVRARSFELNIALDFHLFTVVDNFCGGIRWFVHTHTRFWNKVGRIYVSIQSVHPSLLFPYNNSSI